MLGCCVLCVGVCDLTLSVSFRRMMLGCWVLYAGVCDLT